MPDDTPRHLPDDTPMPDDTPRHLSDDTPTPETHPDPRRTTSPPPAIRRASRFGRETSPCKKQENIPGRRPRPGFLCLYRERPGFFCLLRLRGCLFRRPSGDIFLESCENRYICDDESICLDTFRHTFFAHLSLLLLWVIFLQADAFAELGGARSSAAGNPAPESRAACAVFEPGGSGSPCGAPSALLDVEDHIEASHPAACRHRAPRLSRPIPDPGCSCSVAETPRRTFRLDPSAAGRSLRTPHSLYCVYRI